MCVIDQSMYEAASVRRNGEGVASAISLALYLEAGAPKFGDEEIGLPKW
jgi:hypothetical protein